ncbi:MAG: tetratricopeptide repeat protein [Acetobacteraceae bacterium]|nr:tetratricopeptide repeat protein [Acetobacteraceae bacterium]
MHSTAGALLEAVQHHRAGRRGEAAAICRAVLAANPRQPRALYISGMLLLDENRADEAAWLFARAVAGDPTHQGARINLARALLAASRTDQALEAAEAGLKAFPDAAELHFVRGTALNTFRRSEEAAVALARAVALDPGHAPSRLNLGNAEADLDRLDEAERHIRAALRLAPCLVEAHASLGFVLTALGRLDEARAACAAAIALAPDFAQAHWNLATAALLAGDFETGFREYEWRKCHDRFRRDFIDLPGHVWNGEAMDGRHVLVQAEQGLGDTIQLSRYMTPIAARGARVTLACDRRLIPLLRHTPGLDAAIDRFGPLPAYDRWIDQMSLPRVFATTPATIPSPSGWLAAPDPAAVAGFAAELPAGRRVGIVWAGNPAHSNDRRRSLPPPAVARLAAAAGARLVSLQVGPRAAEAGQYGFHDLSPRLTDYAATAAAVSALDLVLCVDTSVAHLAGALGRPAWVMLPYAPDWRWMLGRDDTPWYQSLRLFRQDRPGDWASVTDRAGTALARYLASPADASPMAQ